MMVALEVVMWVLITAGLGLWLGRKLVAPELRDRAREMTEEERERYDRRVAKLPLDDGKPPS